MKIQSQSRKNLPAAGKKAPSRRKYVRRSPLKADPADRRRRTGNKRTWNGPGHPVPPRTVTREDMFYVRFGRGRLSRTDAIALCGVTESTFRRWENGETRIPRAAFELLSIVADGRLPPLAGNQWEGWHFLDGELYAPNGWHFSPAELMRLPYVYQLAHMNNRPGQQLELFSRSIYPETLP